ncbi:MAG TPA: O-antigen ligase family protein, partial [Opitutaceae bacterium]|nr:O-antigen ligase family protein [Opitutaceae bacterium]
MNSPAFASLSEPRPGALQAAWMAEDVSPLSAGLFSPSAWICFLAGSLTAFTVSLVGEMPIGEIFLIAVAGWVVLCAILNHAWPGALLRNRFFWTLLIAQAVALGSYVMSDLYRRSFPRDMARGWSRMILLAIDIIAIAYLFGRSRRNFLFFLFGLNLGDVADALIHGPLFGDMWKFGVGFPLTVLVLFLAPLGGRWITMLGAGGMGVLNFVQDYRSLGGLCLAVGALTFLQTIPRRLRGWAAPFGAAAAIGSVVLVYQYTEANATRATRSDVERSAMMEASFDAIRASPFIGYGSWFSNTDVYDNFMLIRQEAARAAHVGGFARANQDDPDLMSFHSQILVAVVEGGILGGTFFFIYGGG